MGEDLLEVAEALEIADQLDAVGGGVAADFAHLVEGETPLLGGEVGVARDADRVLDVEHHRVVLELGQVADLPLHLLHRGDGAAADVVHEDASPQVAPVGDRRLAVVARAQQLFERLEGVAAARLGRRDDADRVAREAQAVELAFERVARCLGGVGATEGVRRLRRAVDPQDERRGGRRVGQGFDFVEHGAERCVVVGQHGAEGADGPCGPLDDAFGGGK